MLPHSVATMYDTDKTRTQLTNGDAIFLKHMNKVLAPEAGQFHPPEDPKFETTETKMGKIMMVDFFEIQTSYLRAVSIHEHEETRKQLKDQHAEAMKEIATMIFTNTYTVEKLNPVLAEIQNTLSRNVTALNINAEASKEVHDLTSSGLNAIMTELDKQNALVSNGFNNLIPSEGTEAAISLEKLTKDLNKEISASEDRTKEAVRTEATGIKANQKYLHNSTGPRNGTKSSGPTTNNSGPAANNSGPTTTTPQTGIPKWPNWVPNAAQEPPPPPEMVTIPRKNVKKNVETGEWDEEWVDAVVKKRNPNPRFAFRDDLEANRKNERIYLNNKQG
jgi:DNA-binding ferritin-like protein (Dps family)